MNELWVIERRELNGSWEFYAAYEDETDIDVHISHIVSEIAEFRKVRYIPTV